MMMMMMMVMVMMMVRGVSHSQSTGSVYPFLGLVGRP
jgi:hypothetical protein